MQLLGGYNHWLYHFQIEGLRLVFVGVFYGRRTVVLICLDISSQLKVWTTVICAVYRVLVPQFLKCRDIVA